MTEIDLADKAIADLRESVAKLEADVEKLETQQIQNEEDEEPVTEDPTLTRKSKIRAISELITQALLKVDSIQISKDLAVEALRNGQRDKSRKVAVLLARRKTIVKKLNVLGDKVDQLMNPPASSPPASTSSPIVD